MRIILEYVEYVNKIKSPIVMREVPITLLWNFLSKITNVGLDFNLNMSLISGYENSLNSSEYMFMVKTGMIDRNLYYVFEESQVLSNLCSFLYDQEYARLYLAINSENRIEFGAVSPDDKLPIGYCSYKTNDFAKICKHIDYNQYFKPEKILNRFKTNVETAFEIKNALNDYYHSYKGDVSVYTTIIDDKFTVVLETNNTDIVNQLYLEKIIREYCGITKDNWYLSVSDNNKKTYFYIYVK